MAFDLGGGVVDQISEAKSKYENQIDAFRRLLDQEAAAAADLKSARIDGVSGAWLVVLTKGGKERSVHDRLVAQGFEVFLPLQPLCAVQARRRGVAAVPFFPRMLFARATLDAERWQAIFSTVGVARVLCDPMRPKGVKPEFIDRLRGRVLDEFLAIGLVDGKRPAPARPKAKDRRLWLKLTDVIDGIMAEGVAERRESVLLSLLSEGHAAVAQVIRK